MLSNRGEKLIFLKNLVGLPGVYFFLLKSVRKQNKFLKKELVPDLKPFRIKNDGSLTESNFKKITSYYAMGVPSILGESLCVLRGAPMTTRERLSMSYLGGISGLLDDLFDEPGKSADHLENFISKPEGLFSANTHEALLKHMYIKGLFYSTYPDKIKNAAYNVFKAQQKSRVQKELDTRENLADLICLKGGNSFLYYRLCLDHHLKPEEEEMLYELGGLMQLGNDIFDVWEDGREDIATIATTTPDIKLLRRIFRDQLVKVHILAKKTGYGTGQIKRFQRIINLGISRVFVCLDQFEDLSTSTNGEFQIKKYSRKQLICDMQKPANQLKAMQYYLKFGPD